MEVFQNINSADPSNSFLSALESSKLNFDDVISSEKNNQSARIIKVENMRYRVENDSGLTKILEQSDPAHQTNPDSQEIQLNDTLQQDLPDFVSSFLQFQIVPLDSQPFITQLPHHLTSFIKEMVTIVKEYNLKINSYDYNFKFSNLNLSVLFSKHDDVLKITVSVNDSNLKNDLTKERQDIMAALLQKNLDSENVDLTFDFLSFEDNNNSNNNSDNQEQQEENNNENEMDD